VYFLKVRAGAVNEPGLLVPRALAERGISNILAPLPALDSALWCPLDGHDGYTVVLFPFIRGESAMTAGLTHKQWRAFGQTLRAVHDSGLATRVRGIVLAEDFALPSAALVRRVLDIVRTTELASPAAHEFAVFWREQAGRIEEVLARAEDLGRALQTRTFPLVLCHADIHAANILAGDDGRIWLIDWDGPKIAPRERDLLFVVGSRIAREVTPAEEEWFFEGYGPVEIDPTALVYYRYERIVEDLGELGKSAMLTPERSEGGRAEDAALAMSFFAAGGDLDRAETVVRHV
jgi:spectinomycin phosphotransferase